MVKYRLQTASVQRHPLVLHIASLAMGVFMHLVPFVVFCCFFVFCFVLFVVFVDDLRCTETPGMEATSVEASVVTIRLPTALVRTNHSSYAFH